MALALIVTALEPAHALPSFARQTGQPCGVCHTDMPGLTPFGRRFKIGGYTLGGGRYRTTPFSAPAADQAPKAETNREQEWVPPIAMFAILGYTHTQAPLPPPTAPHSTNDNVVLSPLSFLWAGAVTDHVGAFAQVSYIGQPVGGFGSNPFARTS